MYVIISEMGGRTPCFRGSPSRGGESSSASFLLKGEKLKHS
jgi:hypothetical protein